MRYPFIGILIIVFAAFYGTTSYAASGDSIVVSKEEVVQTIKMFKNLGEKGVDIQRDSVFLSEEFKRLITDEAYRREIYPDMYTWEHTIQLIKLRELKKAFWYLINLYPQSENDKAMVIQSVVAYDAAMKMDKILINTFYTYAFTDPESSKIVDNVPEITRPDVLENKLQTLQELVAILNKYRSEKANQK